MPLPHSRLEKIILVILTPFGETQTPANAALKGPTSHKSPSKSFPAHSQTFLKTGIYNCQWESSILRWFFRAICTLPVQWLQDKRCFMHCSSCYSTIFLKLWDIAVAVNHCNFHHSPWCRQLMAVLSQDVNMDRMRYCGCVHASQQAGKCLKEGEAPTRLGFASGWDWHLPARSRRAEDGRSVAQSGRPDEPWDRQEHCTVQTECPNEDMVSAGAPSNDLMSLRHPIFLSLPEVIWRHKLVRQQQISIIFWSDKKSQSTK